MSLTTEWGGDPIHQQFLLQTQLTPALVAANSVAEQIFVVPVLPIPVGQLAQAFVDVNKPTAQVGLGIAGSRVIDATHIAIWFANTTAAGITPTAAELYTFFVVW